MSTYPTDEDLERTRLCAALRKLNAAIFDAMQRPDFFTSTGDSMPPETTDPDHITAAEAAVLTGLARKHKESEYRRTLNQYMAQAMRMIERAANKGQNSVSFALECNPDIRDRLRRDLADRLSGDPYNFGTSFARELYIEWPVDGEE